MIVAEKEVTVTRIWKETDSAAIIAREESGGEWLVLLLLLAQSSQAERADEFRRASCADRRQGTQDFWARCAFADGAEWAEEGACVAAG